MADVSPRRIADNHDIIFVSLKTLKSEFHQAGKLRESSTRSREGCIQTSHPPPLMCIDFELLIVDETQKLEGESISQVGIL